MGIKTFFLERCEDLYDYSLRRFTYSKGSTLNKDEETIPDCVTAGRGHDAIVYIGRHPGYFGPSGPASGDVWYHGDTRWPKKCERCAYEFRPLNEWQLFVDPMYKRWDTGELLTLRNAPVGAMWFADWMTYYTARSPDGHVLCVQLPGNYGWMPESRASNCDMACKHCGKPYHAHKNAKGEQSGRCQPNWEYGDTNPHYEDVTPHFCWVRHGTPPKDLVHVDKAGVTCGAGAGSIAIPNWHGFLHNGELVG